MSLKRKTRVNESFSMASMTDVIFLLLIFFMVTSTLIVPNAIKVNLPSSRQQAPPEVPPVRVTVSKDSRFFLAFGQEKGNEVLFEELAPALQGYAQKNPESYLAIYADQSVSYREVVAVINIAAPLQYKIVLATQAQGNR
ncbi:ExbD/TolR family protein [Porphyromonas macacae]|uniref:ExbD/TolR family protein n=1 Tax=Porphyromonas macacae TaxID=28115 RepID=UPI0035A175AB